jgi:hypothetical protein
MMATLVWLPGCKILHIPLQQSVAQSALGLSNRYIIRCAPCDYGVRRYFSTSTTRDFP